MKELYRFFRFPLCLLLFWMLCFAAFRLWFVLWFRDKWPLENLNSIWMSFLHGFQLDLSTAGYLMAAPLLLWMVFLFQNEEKQNTGMRLIHGIQSLLINIVVIVMGSNIFLYEEWHTLINNRALAYLSSPRALLDSLSTVFIIEAIVIYFAAIWALFAIYKKMVGPQVFSKKIPIITAFSSCIVIPVLLFLAIRGGLSVMPINESSAYHSPYLFNNHAATNPLWHFIHSLIEVRKKENPYIYLSNEEAAKRTSKLLNPVFPKLAENQQIFDQNPDSLNVVFIIMESMTADVVGSLGGEKGVSPALEKLISEGIVFDDCYGSGYRTDQGIVSVLSGYPAQPDQSVILLEDKMSKLSSVPAILKEKGYNNSFFYGGELTFANMGVYLAHQKFDLVRSIDDFSSAEKTQKWGIDDRTVLLKAAHELGKLPEPFFSNILTLSLHPPFDVPFQSRWDKQGTDSDKFLNGAAFADDAIGSFFTEAQKQPWFERTIFVLVADHGSSLPFKHRMDSPGSRRIPLIITGPPLKKEYRGTKIASICNHHDIPATVLGLLKVPNKGGFPWSRDLSPVIFNKNTNKRDGFAYYTNENGIGWVTEKGTGFFSFTSKDWFFFQNQLDEDAASDAKAYMQALYDDFLKLDK